MLISVSHNWWKTGDEDTEKEVSSYLLLNSDISPEKSYFSFSTTRDKALKQERQAKKIPQMTHIPLPSVENETPKEVLEDVLEDKVTAVRKQSSIKQVWQLFFEIMRFLFIFGASFGVITLFLNAPAYSKVFSQAFLTQVDTISYLQKISHNSSFASFVPDNSSAKNIGLQPLIPGYHLVIPRLSINAPIKMPNTLDLSSNDFDVFEDKLQEALKHGVVHYPNTSYPNEKGNMVLTGHSSYFPWDNGTYKDIFAILHTIEKDDDIIIFHNGEKIHYKVSKMHVISPEQTEVLNQTDDDRITLITCTPVGTTLRRFVVVAQKIS
jgi:LPXTG-site transpeptidase (sortase) family protein